jgi:hypothetical protein
VIAGECGGVRADVGLNRLTQKSAAAELLGISPFSLRGKVNI